MSKVKLIPAWCRGGALAAAAFLLIALPGVARAADPIKLDFAGSFTWFGQVPIMVALDKGYFKDEGIDLTFQVILNSGDRILALTAGSIAFSNLGRVAAINEMAKGNQTFYYFANVDNSRVTRVAGRAPGSTRWPTSRARRSRRTPRRRSHSTDSCARRR